MAVGLVRIGEPNCLGPQSENYRFIEALSQLQSRAIRDAQPNRSRDEAQAFMIALDSPLQKMHRRRAEEGRDESVRGRIVNFQRRANLLQFACRENGDAMAEQQRVVLIVRDAERRRRPAAVDFQ